ncbi:hypothetical protein [Robbsia sp. KACC 23696]|uniref:hypothetical protein n=1 Tax=Robbsia sp. KACC 23696 TaxID=3149231 RepID=UPI00325B1A5D
MANGTYVPLASISGAVIRAAPDCSEELWQRLRRYEVHHDAEICRLWARLQEDEALREAEVRLVYLRVMWQRLADFGATEDAEVRRLWRLFN